MKNFQDQIRQRNELNRLVKAGLIRVLFRQRQITQAQFERLMRLQRA